MPDVAKLNLDDLCPEPASFQLSTHANPFVLQALHLGNEIKIKRKLGAKGLQDAIASQDLALLLPIAWILLDDEGKAVFKSEDALAESIVTYKDRNAFREALLTTFGLSQPVLENLTDQLEEKSGNASAPEPTGAPSTKNAEVISGGQLELFSPTQEGRS